MVFRWASLSAAWPSVRCLDDLSSLVGRFLTWFFSCFSAGTVGPDVLSRVFLCFPQGLPQQAHVFDAVAIDICVSRHSRIWFQAGCWTKGSEHSVPLGGRFNIYYIIYTHSDLFNHFWTERWDGDLSFCLQNFSFEFFLQILRFCVQVVSEWSSKIQNVALHLKPRLEKR